MGTGCGIIPLLMLRDNKLLTAVGVDISDEATVIASKTVKDQKIENFKIINSNLTDLKGKVEFGFHTLVTCNPPYKAPNGGIKNPDRVLEVARHETECTLEDIVSVGAKLLQTGGRLCMCPPRTVGRVNGFNEQIQGGAKKTSPCLSAKG